jgi:hypothetical protein
MLILEATERIVRIDKGGQPATVHPTLYLAQSVNARGLRRRSTTLGIARAGLKIRLAETEFQGVAFLRQNLIDHLHKTVPAPTVCDG